MSRLPDWRSALDPSGRPITYLFPHIPKTAGTSLRLALGRAIPRVRRAWIYAPGELKGAITAADVARLPQQPVLVYGHFPYGLHEQLPWPCRYATVLREPVRRVASLHSMYTRTRPEWVEGKSLRDWALGGALQADNEMVRQISGDLRAPFRGVDDAMLAQAIEHLETQFDVVLVTEHLNDGLPVLESTLRVRLPSVGRENVGRDYEIPDDVRLDILDLNRYDAELYECALLISQAQIRDSPGAAPRRFAGIRLRR